MSEEMKQIYIVDDDISVRRALKLLLLTHGFEVNTYASTEDFFSGVPNSVEGCLILDIHMPGLNGWDTQAKLKQTRSTRPVIMMSVDRSSNIKQKALDSGAVGFLQKPFTDQELIGLLGAAVFNNEESLISR